MKRLIPIIIMVLLTPLLGGCALFPSSLRGMERLAVVQALGVDRETSGGGLLQILLPGPREAQKLRDPLLHPQDRRRQR